MFISHEISFSDVSTIDLLDISEDDVLLVGGGDLLNDFYGLKYREVLSKINSYKIAVCVGISFEDCIKRNYIDFFDDIILRSKKDLLGVSKILGSSNTHYLPDLGFYLDIPDQKKKIVGKNVGFFLVGSLNKNMSFVFQLSTFISWLITNNYHIHLISMYTNEKVDNNDSELNNILFETFKHTNKITSYDELTFEQFLSKISEMDYGVCMRFHGHVFCTRLGVPFLSVPITRKVDIFMEELPKITQNIAKMKFDSRYNVESVDIEDVKKTFFYIRDNHKEISDSLLKFSNININAGFDKIINLIENRKKRTTKPDPIVIMNPEEIYMKYVKIFSFNGINIFTDECLKVITENELNIISDSLCYEITKDPANEYVFGTRINIKNNVKKLRDMVYYIYQNHSNRISYSKINLNYIKQDSFRDLHRSGWQYAIDSLYCVSGNQGYLLDTYLDRSFIWSSDLFKKFAILPYTNRWICFVHHTFNEEYTKNNLVNIFNNKLFVQSLPLCGGIFCLTNYLKVKIKENLKLIGYEEIRVKSFKHPTVFPTSHFDIEKFEKKLRVINIGSWYRNPITIYKTSMNYENSNNYDDDIEKFTFHSLYGKKMISNFCPKSFTIKRNSNGTYQSNDDIIIWVKYFVKYLNNKLEVESKNSADFKNEFSQLVPEGDENYTNIHEDDIKTFLDYVNIMQFLPNDEFDMLLLENIVFLDLVDASACNTIIECIVRNTPIIINKIEPTVEALGEDYPLFYEKIEDIVGLLKLDKIRLATDYLSKLDKEDYRIENFTKNFVDSI
jgi:polysaccharide pyruvyl transferase WcaK-like protein